VNFNSPEFLVFLPVVILLYLAVFHREHLRDAVLLVASYAFYMSWNWRYAGLIALSTLIDYLIGLRMARESVQVRRKALLVASLILNLGLLGVFKYFNFFLGLANEGAHLLGVQVSLPFHHLLLPVGISFYTFQTLSYSIDLYHRRIEHEPSLVKFAVYVAFFPQLVAGPIVRAIDFLPQLHATPEVTRGRVDSGLRLVFQGLLKKVVLADTLASLGVDAVFARPEAFSSLDLMLALYGYAFQIYCDFSGYSDIAIGAARMMGFDLTPNFNRPYLSQNVREFWTRWHISLSSWLRDYLYIALGGSRGRPGRVRFNLMATMVLGGLWHGAAVNFILWGAYHGVLLMFARGATKHDDAAPLGLKVLRRISTFHLVLVSWLLFRVSGWDNFVAYVRGLAQLTWDSQLSGLYVAVLATAAALHFVPQDRLARLGERFTGLPAPLQASAYAGLMLLFVTVSFGAPAFIYFQF
jgi:alginate O-acetyltransferase complex protein AlgI